MTLFFVALTLTLTLLSLRVSVRVAPVVALTLTIPHVIFAGDPPTQSFTIPPVYVLLIALIILYPLNRLPKPKKWRDVAVLIAVNLSGIALLALAGSFIIAGGSGDYQVFAFVLLSVPTTLTHYLIDRKKQ